MKKNLFCLCTAILALVSSQCLFAEEENNVLPPFPEKLNLQEAKKIALAQHPSLQVTVARLQAATAELEQVQGDNYPTLDFFANVRRTQEVPSSNGGTGHSHYTTYETGLEFSWLLFDGMARKYNTIVQEGGVKIAEANHLDAQRNLLLAVSTAYFNALQELENIRIATEDLNYNKDLQETAQKKLDRGAGNRSDVLNFQIKAKDAEARLIESQLSLKLYYFALAELLGYGPADIPAKFTLEPVADYSKEPELSSVTFYIDYALEHRPDYLAQKEFILQKEADRSSIEADHYPQLGIFADYSFQRADNPKFNHEDDSLAFGAQVKWNIFNGHKTRAKVAKALAETLEADAQLKELGQQIRQQIANQHTSTAQARSLAVLKNETKRLAEETRDLVRKEYDVGRVTATRLNEAQTDLTNAEGDYIKAVIRYWQYRENLSANTAQILEDAR